jgi:flavodoxin
MKITAVAAAVLFLFFGCAGTQKQSLEAPPSGDPSGRRTLVAYFSRTGSTEALAKIVQKTAGGDLFKITPSTPYPADYQECLQRASQERADNFRPPLATRVENMAAYDVVFIGYPIWLGNVPMVIRSFLEAYDFSGKTVIPFCTHGGSGLSGSAAAVKALCPGSVVLEGLAVKGTNAAAAQGAVSIWIRELGL